MYCDITLPNGKPFEGNCRGYLQSVIKRARAMGLTCNVGCECEFYLFETDENGNPTRIPLDMGGYFDIPPLDKGENIRREICFAIEEMGLHPEHSHHESGHGQNEVCFRYTTALKSADNLNTFKSTVKAIAARNGLFASFMPKPLANQPGSGLHVNISLLRDGKNLFDGDFTPDSEAGHFVAGILAHARGADGLLQPGAELLRAARCQRGPALCQLEPPEPQPAGAAAQRPRRVLPRGAARPRPGRQPVSCHRADSGRRSGRHRAQAALPEAVNRNLFHPSAAAGLESLPRTLREAITVAGQSEFISAELPVALQNKYFEYQTQLCHDAESAPPTPRHGNGRTAS